MTITFCSHELDAILAAAHPTPFSSGVVAERLKQMYAANFEEDLKSIIEYLEDEEAHKES